MDESNASSVSSIVSDTLGLQGQLTRATETIHKLKTENQTLSENNQRLFDKLQESRQKLNQATEQHTTTLDDYMKLSREFLEAQRSWEEVFRLFFKVQRSSSFSSGRIWKVNGKNWTRSKR